MKGSAKVIERLNEALFLELGAVNQYWLHYRMLDDWGLTKLAKKERAESIEEMQHADKIIARILFGKGVGELTAFEAAQLANTAAELSGGGIGGFGVLSQIQDSLGLDVLRVDQGSSGGTTVSAGKYLREGFYVGVEQGALASDSNVKVEIDVTRNISVETKIGNDSSSDVGVNWKWDY